MSSSGDVALGRRDVPLQEKLDASRYVMPIHERTRLLLAENKVGDRLLCSSIPSSRSSPLDCFGELVLYVPFGRGLYLVDTVILLFADCLLTVSLCSNCLMFR